MRELSNLKLSYTKYKEIFEGKKLPLAFVDMELLDENIHQILHRSKNIPIRIASKSIRCTYILDHIFKANNQFQGIMSFSGEEAVFLSKKGFDDILIAYPVTNREVITDICQEIKSGRYINLMTDKSDHVHLITEV